MNNRPQIAAVVLSYNSERDLPGCLHGLQSQRGVDLLVVVVDNASVESARIQSEEVFSKRFPNGQIVDVGEVIPRKLAGTNAILIRNTTNGGYSAGNNIGARLAADLGCDAILFVNPDIRIENPNYVCALFSAMTRSPQAGAAASKIRNLSGKQENPMPEPSYFEELTWPLRMVRAGFRIQKYKPPLQSKLVTKVSGACFLIKVPVLKAIDYFDENVFLYCEESILSAKLKSLGYMIMFCAHLECVHAHDPSQKSNSYDRFRKWSRSRAYFHRNYTKRNVLERALLSASRAVMLLLIRLNRILATMRRDKTTRQF